MAKKFLLLFLLFLPFSIQGQADSVVINEIAWPVEAAEAAHGLKMGTIVINEVAWMGSSVQDVDSKQWWRYEWLELYNNADTVGMLDGWTLELHRDTLDFRIPLRGAISPKGYFLIGASDKIQNLDLNYKNLAGKFNNSGQKVVLKNALGEVVDEMDARNGWPAGDNASKATMERCEVCDIGFQTSENPGGTPKAQNSSGLMAQKPVDLKPSETKKDISMSSDKESQNIFNSTTLVALVLALGSSVAVVLLRRRLSQA